MEWRCKEHQFAPRPNSLLLLLLTRTKLLLLLLTRTKPLPSYQLPPTVPDGSAISRMFSAVLLRRDRLHFLDIQVISAFLQRAAHHGGCNQLIPAPPHHRSSLPGGAEQAVNFAPHRAPRRRQAREHARVRLGRPAARAKRSADQPGRPSRQVDAERVARQPGRGGHERRAGAADALAVRLDAEAKTCALRHGGTAAGLER